jgi:hypothetical protein
MSNDLPVTYTRRKQTYKNACKRCGADFVATHPAVLFCSFTCRSWRYQEKKICKVDGCENHAVSKAMCGKHYYRQKKYGDPLKCGHFGFKSGKENFSCTPERRKVLREIRLGKPLTEEAKRKQSESLKKTIARPEIRAKWVAAATGRKQTPEMIAKRVATRAAKPKKRTTLLKMADQAYSIYIRTLNADQNGYVRCFTCESVHKIAEMDCGHFASRRHMSTRFLEKNTEPQCRYCNRFNEGRKDVFSLRLIEKYGPDILREIHETRNIDKKWSSDELLELIETYQNKLKELG